MKKLTITTILIILLTTIIAACQSAPEGPAEPAISIEGAWGRPSPKVATAGAFYMTIMNEGREADRLISAESSACGVVELHESYETEEGAMGMRPVEGGAIEIPAGGEAELKMGGLHIMCIDKLEDFEAGAVLPLTLNFEKTGEIEMEIEIREP